MGKFEVDIGVIKKMSKKRVFSEEHRRKIGEANSRRVWLKESRQKLSESQKNRAPLSEETKRKISESHKGKTHSEETKLKMSKSHKNPSDETRRKISESLIGNKRGLGYKHTDEARRKTSEAGRNRAPPSVETRRKMSESHRGSNNSQWKGGVSYGEYCEKFNEEFKEKIREKYNRKCFLCNKSEEDEERKLGVHHVNFNKDCLCDDSDCEFVPLCVNCHGRTNGDRDYWELMIMYMIENSCDAKERRLSLIKL